jgi:type II secretory pathway pseudopilin PulG
MKRTVKLLLVVIGALSVIAAYFLYATNSLQRNNSVESNSNLLILALDVYWNAYGEYPTSIFNITNMYNDMGDKTQRTMTAHFINLQRDHWGNKYTYTRLEKGFEICITGSDVAPMCWFGKKYKLVRKHTIEESSLRSIAIPPP